MNRRYPQKPRFIETSCHLFVGQAQIEPFMNVFAAGEFRVETRAQFSSAAMRPRVSTSGAGVSVPLMTAAAWICRAVAADDSDRFPAPISKLTSFRPRIPG